MSSYRRIRLFFFLDLIGGSSETMTDQTKFSQLHAYAVFLCALLGGLLQALDLDGDYLTHLNYAVTLLNNDEPEKATEHFAAFKQLFEVL